MINLEITFSSITLPPRREMHNNKKLIKIICKLSLVYLNVGTIVKIDMVTCWFTIFITRKGPIKRVLPFTITSLSFKTLLIYIIQFSQKNNPTFISCPKRTKYLINWLDLNWFLVCVSVLMLDIILISSNTNLKKIKNCLNK